MDILSFLKLDPKLWPFAVLAFLRIVTIFYFLPIIGNKAVPTQLRVALAIVITFTLWPFIADSAEKNTDNFHWDVWTLAVLTVQEVFFGFTFCFAAKFIIFAISIMSNLVGVNMGFHAASMFNPNTEDRESSFSALANWIVLVLIVLLNIPQFFLMNIAKSFTMSPIGILAQSGLLTKSAILLVQDCFILGLKLSAPLIVMQILTTISLGLLNRAMPQFNALVINFPASFLLTITVLFLTLSTFLNVVAKYGFQKEVGWVETILRVF